MKPHLLACLMVPALFSGCSDKEQSTVMTALAPSPIIEVTAKAHGIRLAIDSEGAGSGKGYSHRTWTYFSREKGMTDDELKAMATEATEGLRKVVTEMGGRAGPVGTWGSYFQVRSFDYTHEGRRGTLSVTAGALERGTAVTVIAEERPE